MAGKYNLQIDQGSTFMRQIKLIRPVFNSDGTVKLGADGYADRTGEPINLTGFTVSAQLKKNFYTAQDSAINMTAAIMSAIDGMIMIALTATQTSLLTEKEYIYDVKIISTDYVMRVIEGKVYVSSEVSQ